MSIDHWIKDRGIGALLGLATGDALGTTLEFKARDTYPPLKNMIGGGVFKLNAGQWTDDTSQALALAESLLHNPNLDSMDLMHRFCDWRNNGAYSCTETCFDIGNATRAALDRFEATGNPIAGSTDPYDAGNGSLMRLAPVSICHWNDLNKCTDVAKRQSELTHGATEAIHACILFSEYLHLAINGVTKEELIGSKVIYAVPSQYFVSIVNAEWRNKSRDHIKSGGYVLHSLEAALWCIWNTNTFSDAVLMASNLGYDADTTAAITGQLAGAIYGASSIPEKWLEKLYWADRIQQLAIQLMESSQGSTQ